jgi:aspartate aminotransferase
MFDEEVISFAHGNGLRAPEPAVVAAGIKALLDQTGFPLERYNFLERYEPLEESIHTTMLREGFPMEHLDFICIDAGTTKLFTSFLSVVTEPGDVVLTAPAFYHGLVGWCRLLKLGVHIVPSTAGESYKLTAANLDAAWCERQLHGVRQPKVVVVFNPTMSGAIYTADELRDVAAFCHEHDVVVIEDNVFARTRYEPYAPIAHLADDERMRDRVVSVDGCSKADGLANLRIGWAVGPAHLIRKMEQIKLATTVALPYVTLVMADTALRLEWGARQRDAAVCRRRAAQVTTSIAEVNELLDLPEDAGFRVVHPPRAGHSIMVDAGALGTVGGRLAPFRTSLQLAEDWLDRAAVAVSPLYSCGLDGREFRLNFASINRTALPGSGRRNHPTALVGGPRISRALARDDRAALGELCRRAEHEATTPPATPADPSLGLIREGLVRRLASALHPRALGRRRAHRVVVRAVHLDARTHGQPEPPRLPAAAVG